MTTTLAPTKNGSRKPSSDDQSVNLPKIRKSFGIMTGCNQLLITPEVKDDGAHRDPQWYDEQRCERIGTTLIKLDNSKTPGFDRQAPK